MPLQRFAVPGEGPQQIGVLVDILPGPATDAVASMMLEVVVDELLRIGAEVAGVRIEVRGQMASW